MKLMKRDFLLISTVVTGLWSDCSEQRLEYECNPPQQIIFSSVLGLLFVYVSICGFASHAVTVAERCGGRFCFTDLFFICC